MTQHPRLKVLMIKTFRTDGPVVKVSMMKDLAHKEVDGLYQLHDLEEGVLFSGRIRILDSSDSPWLQHEYSNGVEDGERIVWVDGKIYERYLYKNGKLVETIVKMGKQVK